VDFGFWAGPKRTNLQTVENGDILVVVGTLPADELKAIKELYRGDVPVHRLGLFRDTPDSAPQEVSVLARAGVVLGDFLRFLRTPEGAETMAKFGVTVYAAGTATENPPPNTPNQP
jgi:hypothetical protein